MKKIIFIVFAVTSLLITSISTQSWAGEVDILVNKLVEKGILSDSEAILLLNEMQKEGVKQEVVIKEVATEAAKEEVKTSMIKLPKWTEKIDLYGDLRLRHDTQWRNEKKSGKDRDKYHRNRERYRLRLGMTAKTTETTEVGVRLASGSGYQNTTNQSFDGHARGKQIWIDKAYASWKPLDSIKIIGGKHKNPLFTTPLVWDPDVNPEGVSECFKFDITDRFGLFANLGQYFIEELKIKDSNSDPTLLAFQLGTSIKPADTMKLEFGVTYYEFMNMDKLEWETEDDTFVGYNDKHGQQMIFDSDGDLLNEWGCWELGAKLKVKDVLPVPFSIFASYIVNADADIDELIRKGDDKYGDPAILEEYGSDDRDTGWLVGLSLGKKKKKGDWYAKYFYQELEDYAFPAVFVDSDFHGGGTNNKGHYIQGRYCLMDNIQVRATGFSTEREDESKDGQKDEDRIQLDVVFAF
ncbi:MAG: putative porin [Thermodesulfobacteriota bacterium]|nr:putative porin [Thermodesulfobacteriota bacterium]